jgi:hypothetical protein
MFRSKCDCTSLVLTAPGTLTSLATTYTVFVSGASTDTSAVPCIPIALARTLGSPLTSGFSAS